MFDQIILPLISMGILCFHLNALATSKIVDLPRKQTWRNTALQCQREYGGQLIGARDPLFQDRDALQNVLGNSRIWTGRYFTDKAYTTEWLKLRGCFNVSTLKANKTLNTMSVYDCYATCQKIYPYSKIFGISHRSCFCHRDNSLKRLKAANMNRCSIDFDGNVYGKSRRTAAMYEIVRNVDNYPQCAIGFDCKEESYKNLHCMYSDYSSFIYPEVCNKIQIRYGQTETVAQSQCGTTSYSYFTDRGASVCTFKAFHYERRYKEFHDSVDGSINKSSVHTFCQIIWTENGLQSKYVRCDADNANHSVLCRTNLTNSVLTTEYVHMGRTEYPDDIETSTMQSAKHTSSTGASTADLNTIGATEIVTTANLREKESKDSGNYFNLNMLMTGLLASLVFITSLVLVVLLITRRKCTGNTGTSKRTANTDFHMKHSSNHQSHSEAQYCDRNDSIEGLIRAQGEENHIPSGRKSAIQSPCGSVYNSPYDELNRHGKWAKSQNESYFTVSENENLEETYWYDLTRDAGNEQRPHDNYYDTAAKLAQDIDGAYAHCYRIKP